MPSYLHFVKVDQMLGHGLDDQLEEEPGELKVEVKKLNHGPWSKSAPNVSLHVPLINNPRGEY